MAERPAGKSPHTRTGTNRRASKHFREVISQGPTAIPDSEDFHAAIESVLPSDESSFGQALRQKQQEVKRRPSLPGEGAGALEPPETSGGLENPAGAADGTSEGKAGDFEGADSGDGGGGLLDWALWPLWGTIDALKWAGGTVNDVAVAPVIRLASPWSLVGSILSTLKTFTPQRARDIGRVFRNGVLNAVKLVRTHKGGKLFRSCLHAARATLMTVSSPTGRQLLMDSATGFVKVAEALDTPEAKNAIQQGAVVIARGMDALASRHTKILVKDLADVLVGFVELANSHEATVMAAEFTANVVHALEMEHLAASGLAAAGPSVSDTVIKSTAGGVSPTPSAQDESETCAHNAASHDSRLVGDRLDPGYGTGEERAKEAKVERAGEESDLEAQRATRPPPVTAAAPAAATIPDGRGDEAGSNVGVTIESDKRPLVPLHRSGDEGTGVTAAELLRRGTRVNYKPIRQEDLTGSTPLGFLRPVAARNRPARKSSLSRRTRSGSSGSFRAPLAPHSAPSSPTGRRTCPPFDAAEMDSSETDSESGRGHRRARSEADAAASQSSRIQGNDEENDDGASETVCRAGDVDEQDHTQGRREGECPASSAAPFLRDGRHFLPRVTGERLASVLRGETLPLEQQLETPNDGSLDNMLARATKPLIEGWSQLSRRAIGGRADSASRSGAGAVAADSVPAADGAPVPPRKPSPGWKQLVLPLLLFVFAADGLRHRWTSLRGDRNAKHGNAKRTPVPGGVDPPVVADIDTSGNGSERGARNRFRAAFLPPTCQHPVTGATMAVWVTPSGPCLLPAPASPLDIDEPDDEPSENVHGPPRREVTNGKFGPGCAMSFPLCDEEEVLTTDGRSAPSAHSEDPFRRRDGSARDTGTGTIGSGAEL